MHVMSHSRHIIILHTVFRVRNKHHPFNCCLRFFLPLRYCPARWIRLKVVSFKSSFLKERHEDFQLILSAPPPPSCENPSLKIPLPRPLSSFNMKSHYDCSAPLEGSQRVSYRHRLRRNSVCRCFSNFKLSLVAFLTRTLFLPLSKSFFSVCSM
jgi:hypothetical protein